MTLKQFIKKNKPGLEDKFKEMNNYVELARNNIDYLNNFDKASECFQYIDGYMWALYVYGILTKEEHNKLFNELLKARRIKQKE